MNCPHCHTENPEAAAFCYQCGTPLESAGSESVRTEASGLRCHIHPDVETALRCGSCERPICVQCVVQHPVGIRCRECARLRKLPQFDVSTGYYARAVGAGVGIALGGAVGLLLLLVVLPFGFLALAGLVGVGYLVGEGISRAANRKLSRGLQYVAGGSVALTYLLTGLVATGIYGLVAVAIAVMVAVGRLRAP